MAHAEADVGDLRTILSRFGGPSLWRLTQMRLRELAREPGTLFWIFAFPLLLTLGLGLAFRGASGARPAVGVVAPFPEPWAAAIGAAGFPVRRASEAEARRALATGALALAVFALPPGARADAAVRYAFDPMRPGARLARLEVDRALQRAWGRVDPVAVRDERQSTPGTRYVDFLVPGLIGMNVMQGSLWGVGWAIVNLRVRKLLKRLRATPMRRAELLVAFMLARLVVVPIETTTLLVFARLVFGVRVAGSLPALAAVATLGALSFGGLAILVASRAQNVETVTGLINTVMIPMFITSGIFFSNAHFPTVLQPLIAALPLSALNQALRAVAIDGAGLAALASPCAILLVWGALGYAVGLRAFRWA
ncbi:MAG TPA: ABC transporter permease [Polyangia bacterium]|nr:ABC transporter permease [Polyangia bacterium]